MNAVQSYNEILNKAIEFKYRDGKQAIGLTKDRK